MSSMTPVGGAREELPTEVVDGLGKTFVGRGSSGVLTRLRDCCGLKVGEAKSASGSLDWRSKNQINNRVMVLFIQNLPIVERLELRQKWAMAAALVVVDGRHLGRPL